MGAWGQWACGKEACEWEGGDGNMGTREWKQQCDGRAAWGYRCGQMDQHVDFNVYNGVWRQEYGDKSMGMQMWESAVFSWENCSYGVVLDNHHKCRMVPFPSLLAFPLQFSFYCLDSILCAIIILIIFCWSALNFLVFFVNFGHWLIIIAMVLLCCCCLCNIFSYVFENFLNHISIALLSGLTKICKCIRHMLFWRTFLMIAHCSLHDKWELVDQENGGCEFMGLSDGVSWDVSSAMGAFGQERWEQDHGEECEFSHSHLHVPIPKSSPYHNWNTKTLEAWWWECGGKRWDGSLGMGIRGQEHGGGSMGMGAWGYNGTNITNFNCNIRGQISQSSNAQSASLSILCYCSIGVSWMVPFPSFLVFCYTFHVLSWQHCATIILVIFCWSECIIRFCLSFWQFIHYHCMLLWAVLLLLLS